MKKNIIKILHRLGYVVASLVIFFALMLSVAKLLTPVLNQHLTEFEKIGADILQRPVIIGHANLSWHRFGPEILLNNLTILDPVTRKPAGVMEQLEIDFSIPRSILHARIFVKNLTVRGVQLTVNEEANGVIKIDKFAAFNVKDMFTGASVKTDEIFKWIFSQNRLVLKDIGIHFVLVHQPIRSLTLKTLRLRNNNAHHVVDGKATLNQEHTTNADINLSWDGDTQDWANTKGNADLSLQDLSFAQWFGKLTWQGIQLKDGLLSGKVALSWDKNKLSNLQSDFQINKTTFALQNIFNNSLYFEHVAGLMQLTRDTQDNLVLQFKRLHLDNRDIAGNAKFSLIIPPVGSPVIDLNSNFNMVNVAHITRYLPLKIFDPELNEWLKSAFISGKAQNGRIIIKGRLDDFPFDNNSGTFFISSHAEDVDFNFAPGWPHIQNIKGQLTFSGRAMVIELESGKILNIPIANIKGAIPYLGDAAPQDVEVNGVIHTDLANALDFIRKSPLQKTLGKELAAMHLSGLMQLKLGLSVPISKPEDTKVTGDVVFDNASMSLPGWKLAFTALKGGFQFTDSSLDAKGLQGLLFNSPATLNITTLSKKKQISADLEGAVSVAALQSWLDTSLSNYAAGATNYNAQLFLSPASQSASQQAHIIINTDLKGVAFTLPAPYNKTAAQQKKLSVDVSIDNANSLKAKVLYDNSLNLLLGLKQSSQHGFELSSADVNSKVLDLQGLQLHNIDLHATILDKTWLIKLKSTEMAGRITLPADTQNQTVQGQLDYLYLKSNLQNLKTKTSLDPRSIPSFSLDVNDVRFDEMKFGHLMLEVAHDKSGLIIRKLRVEEASSVLNASGDWLLINEKSHSHLKGEMSTPHIAELLAQWGFNSDALVGSTGNATFDLQWNDSPFRFSVAGLMGNLTLKLGKGRIVEISDSSNAQLGLGRLLNVFSLSSIPRRLSLDFSDLVEKGYSFDYLKSAYTLKNGSAYIDTMEFNGPIARVVIDGRIGLAAKDLDIKLGVTPYVTGSLPVVAAIAGGPIVGVATWVVDKAISHQVSNVTKHDYSVTGSWANPVWTKLAGQQRGP